MRDKLIHDYFGVNVQLVWDAVERDLPQLYEKMKELLATPHRSSKDPLDIPSSGTTSHPPDYGRPYTSW